jgi:methylphosphotriester-DNA--protein-cysteine methyltransferase
MAWIFIFNKVITVPFKSIGIEYRQILALASTSIGDTAIDTAFENYRRYYHQYRKSIGDTADTDILSRY